MEKAVATAQAQPNIALIKYWGKRDVSRNLPAVGSLSLTLATLWTRMKVEFSTDFDRDCLQVDGEVAVDMLPRVSRCLDQVAGSNRPRASIESHCNFPIAAGLASSASAFAALVVAANKACGQASDIFDEETIAAVASRDTLALARLAGAASGSAARSLFGGIVELATGDDDIDVATLLAASTWPLRVVVAVTERGHKSVASGDAMILSEKSSPFYSSWIENQDHDLEVARSAVNDRDFEKLATVSEHNCLKMHSVMWTSRPPIVYWNQGTLACMEAIRDLQSAGQAVFFTMDAGPQVKAICQPDNEALVMQTLSEVDGVETIMSSGLGAAACILDDA
ncbi:MAG: diphosphomevalonate decarboxylase [Proteobacteria bacterium]|nr:diphosphomevalonate decarboxylase [Pseudomonadota bacterium]